MHLGGILCEFMVKIKDIYLSTRDICEESAKEVALNVHLHVACYQGICSRQHLGGGYHLAPGPVSSFRGMNRRCSLKRCISIEHSCLYRHFS